MPTRLARSIPQLVCACGEEAFSATFDSSRGIVNKQTRECHISLEWRCMNGHDHFGWLPEDEANALMRAISNQERDPATEPCPAPSDDDCECKEAHWR